MNGRVTCHLHLTEIIELVYLFVIDEPVDKVVKMTERSKQTVVDWFDMCWEVCSSIVRSHPLMIGTHIEPIQIESLELLTRGNIIKEDSYKGTLQPSPKTVMQKL